VIDPPQIVRSRAESTAVIRIEVPRSEIQKVMEPAITEVLEVLRVQGVQPAGPLISYHRSRTRPSSISRSAFPSR